MRSRKRRVRSIVAKLEQSFGVPQRGRRPNPLGALISGILSQNTTDHNRDRAYASLRRAFPTWEDALKAKPGAIAQAIRVGGLASQRAKRIRGVLSWVKETYGRLNLDPICDLEPEEATARLESLEGVGMKTARVVLLFACGMDLFPVDTHILRVSKRLGLLPANCNPERAHRLMAEMIPKRKAYSLHLNLIRLGRTLCKPGRPRCPECPLLRVCAYGKSPG